MTIEELFMLAIVAALTLPIVAIVIAVVYGIYSERSAKNIDKTKDKTPLSLGFLTKLMKNRNNKKQGVNRNLFLRL